MLEILCRGSFIVRDFARTDSSEPSVQVWKKRKKASCLKKPYGKINYYISFIFSKGGGRGQHHFRAPGRVAQSVTCLATDACLTADPGVASSIPARYHTFVEIDHEIISTVILPPSADLFKKGCCQLQAKVCAQITG